METEDEPVQLLYPERRAVPASTVMGWARDAIANEEASEWDGTLADAIALLEDLGHITVYRKDYL